MLNALTVDLEEYFQVEAFASRVSVEDWDNYPSRVERNLDRILGLFDEYRVSATFFVLGWVAKRFPRLVRRIAEAGHEVGSHGSYHRHLIRQSPSDFRADLKEAKMSLADEVQRPVQCYRAPSFSIVRQTMWALDVLVEEGFEFDSSIFPVRHDLYGVPDAPRFPHWRETPTGQFLFEFPPSTVRCLRNNFGVGGGGYLRFAPYNMTRWALRRINERERQPAMVYFHPWELDPDQPRITASWRSTMRHYTNLTTMEGKVKHLLRDFRFTKLSDVCRELEAFRGRALVD